LNRFLRHTIISNGLGPYLIVILEYHFNEMLPIYTKNPSTREG